MKEERNDRQNNAGSVPAKPGVGQAVKRVFDTIRKYADAYWEMEQLQPRIWKRLHGADTIAPLPRGDQKTGVVAEFYSLLYAGHAYPRAAVSLAGGKKHWDIEVRYSRSRVRKIQVKAVSAHSGTRRVSPIHKGWHELYLLWLDEELWPGYFRIIDASSIKSESWPLRNKTMPGQKATQVGSKDLRGGVDKLGELLASLRKAKAGKLRLSVSE
ncbi:MAG: hypothetical protein NTX53_18550 [candidate division WOR-3 bacterium]|nr:hypothetical protein [candidate division WOR-3 bacterium]